MQQTVQVMSATASVKTSLMRRPQAWVLYPAMLQRTTAENIFKALSARSPIELDGSSLPTFDDVKWLWIVTVADGASSNLRFQVVSGGEKGTETEQSTTTSQ